LNGSLDNDFYTKVLKAKFVMDGGVNEDSWKLTGITDGDIAQDWPNRDIASPLNPLIKEDPADPYQQATQTRAPDTLYIRVHGTDMVRTDGSLNQAFPDHIMPLTGALGAYAYVDGLGDGAIYNIDPMTNGRAVYLSFGLESLLREYDAGTNAQIVLNFRSKLLHNALCWASTGQISGRVVDVNGLKPVGGAVVRATPDPTNVDSTGKIRNGAVPRTAVTDANGNFVIRGLVPQPRYDVEAGVPGYTSEHVISPAIHGIGETFPVGDIHVHAAPGSISGTVKNTGGSAVPGAVVVATLTPPQGYAGPLTFTATTSGEGVFTIGNLPVGSYKLTIDPTFLQGSGYSSSTPPSLTAGVQAGKDTPNTNFVLGGGTSTNPGNGGGGGTTPPPGTGLKTFQPGLVMLSVPYDYPNDDAAALLGLQPADLTQKLATYMSDAAGFSYYANSVAAHLRLGRGYFVRLSKAATITKTGTPAPTNQNYNLALNTGWNLIGDPFIASINWGAVKVQVPGQNTPITETQAVQQGVLKSGLLTLNGGSYVSSSSLDPWVGYWIRATKPVTLVIPPPGSTGTGNSTTPASQPTSDVPPSP
jgi:hypothetical protein